MPFQMQTGHPFDDANVSLLAPVQAGVYGLYTSQRWVYIGQSQNIRDRLQQHLAFTDACLMLHRPGYFVYEIVAGEEARLLRERSLIAELTPACNQR